MADVLRGHETSMEHLARLHGLGPLASRSVEGDPRGNPLDLTVTYRFEHGSITSHQGHIHIDRGGE
jgi:hypothetical protein